MLSGIDSVDFTLLALKSSGFEVRMLIPTTLDNGGFIMIEVHRIHSKDAVCGSSSTQISTWGGVNND